VAFVAEVIAAGVLGACDADAGGFFFADGAEKRHGSNHSLYLALRFMNR
jgi:hypothetical protein